MAQLTSVAEQNKKLMDDLKESMEFLKRNWKNKEVESGEGGSSTKVVKPATSKNTGYLPGFSSPTPTHFATANEPLFLEDPRFTRALVVETGLQAAIFSSSSEPSVQAQNHQPQVRPHLVLNPITGIVHYTVVPTSVVPPSMNLPPLLNQYLNSTNYIQEPIHHNYNPFFIQQPPPLILYINRSPTTLPEHTECTISTTYVSKLHNTSHSITKPKNQWRNVSYK